jgi:RNA polymerase sigma factor (sigma-70 family)
MPRIPGNRVPLNTLPKLGGAAGQSQGAGVPALSQVRRLSEVSETGELMGRVQRDDMEAYQELIRRYQKKVFRVIATYHRDPEDAMEVLQDTFLKLYTARQTWERRSSFSGWLYRIAINASIDRYRRDERKKTSSLDEIVETQEHSSATFRSDHTPLDQLREGERRRLLEAAVRRLPERQREIVSLRYFGEMQLEEIAQALRCPLGTVKSNLHKAVLGLKGMLVQQKEALS